MVYAVINGNDCTRSPNASTAVDNNGREPNTAPSLVDNGEQIWGDELAAAKKH